MENLSYDELYNLFKDDSVLLFLLNGIYEDAYKRVTHNKAGVYSSNYESLVDHHIELLKKTDLSDEEQNKSLVDQKKYVDLATKQYINNIIGVSNSGVQFNNYDGSIAFDGNDGCSFDDDDLIKKRLADLLRIYGERTESKNSDDVELESEKASNSVTDDFVAETPDKNEEYYENEKNAEFHEEASIVQYRNALKDEMLELEKEMSELNIKPNNMSLSDGTFKKLLKLKKQHDSLEIEYNKTMNPDYESEILSKLGILNKPIAFSESVIDSLNKKEALLNEIKKSLKTNSSKGITDIKIKFIKNICSIFKNINVTANTVQRGIIFPKVIYEKMKNKFISNNLATDEYYDAVISDIELKMDNLDEHKFADKIATEYNKFRLKRYMKKKEWLQEFLETVGISKNASFVGCQIRPCKKSKRDSMRNEIDDISILPETIEGMSK